MTTNPTPPPPPAPPAPSAGPALAAPVAERPKPPLRIALTILQLAGLGVVGAGVLAALTSLLTAGLATLLVFGIGLVLLVGLVYALFGVGWFEVARADGLYGLGVSRLQWRPQTGPGFGGWLRALGRQAVDGRMWRALVNFTLACIAGAIVLRLFWSGIVWAMIAFAPLTGAETVQGAWGGGIRATWAPLAGILGALACAAMIIGLALLHRVLTRALIVPSREAELTQQVRTTSAQREGAVRAADVERTRIERDLHDGVQPRLVSVGMTLGLAQQKIDSDPAAAKALIDEAHTSTKAAITELRQLARGIHASVLDDRGLDAALSALASRSHIPVQLDVRLDPSTSSGTQNIGSLSPSKRGCRDAEAAVYFAIAESLTNAAKHSRASECRVVVRTREGGVLWARVEDNGMGGAQVQPGGGLDGISNRVLAAGGTFRLDSPIGGPTALEVTVPCAS
ncbi:sensor histidine kinase [Microbacterium sp. KUDC0406]|uniref:sensor histidine kinase n=1 Tax=Microbacterium sp. KUDC0406 TaxID=2909588 RepID=UPI001F34E9D2|nr:sensor histidine kinase [Microbacterium sp. KUDC0406]UJP09543.1 sensor histidine kinase [Microbacterium sp. KUDC0406]